MKRDNQTLTADTVGTSRRRAHPAPHPEVAYLPLTAGMQQVLNGEVARQRQINAAIIAASGLAGVLAVVSLRREASLALLVGCCLAGTLIGTGLVWLAMCGPESGASAAHAERFCQVRGPLHLIRVQRPVGEHLSPAYYLRVGEWDVQVSPRLHDLLKVAPTRSEVVTVACHGEAGIIFEIRDAQGMVLYCHPRYRKHVADSA